MESYESVPIEFEAIPEFFSSKDILDLAAERGISADNLDVGSMLECRFIVKIGDDLYINLGRLEMDYGPRP